MICFYLYGKLMEIILNLVATLLLLLHCSMFVLFVALIILLSCFVAFLFKKKKFNEIKIWHLVCILTILGIFNYFNVPNRLYHSSSSLYSASERDLIIIALTYSRFCVTIILVLFSYYKYRTYKKNYNTPRNSGSKLNQN